MKLEFITTPVDQTICDLLVIGGCEEERPLCGYAGLIDWRLYGWLSQIIREERFLGSVGERLLIPGADTRLPCRWLMLLGLGASLEFNAERASSFASEALAAAEQLRMKSVGLFYPNIFTVKPYHRHSLEWLLQGLSTNTNDIRLMIPSQHAEVVDLEKVMLPKLLEWHSLQP